MIDHPFTAVSAALREPGGWCDIMMLPFNTKYCRASGTREGATLDVRIGRKPEQPVEQAYRIAFALGTCVTALSGGLLATNFPFHPFVGLEFVIMWRDAR